MAAMWMSTLPATEVVMAGAVTAVSLAALIEAAWLSTGWVVSTPS